MKMSVLWAVILTIKGKGEDGKMARLPYGVGVSAIEAAADTTRAIADYANKGNEADKFGTEFVSLLVKCYSSDAIPNAFDTSAPCVECGSKIGSICWENCSSWEAVID